MSEQGRRRGAPPSHLATLLRLGAAELRQRAAPRRPRPAPRRRLAVDREAIPVDPRRLDRYLAVTRGAEGIRWRAAGVRRVSPAYSALWETALLLELLLDSGRPLPAQGLIHAGGEMLLLRPLLDGDLVRCRCELDSEQRHPRGTLLGIVCRNWNARGQLCSETRVRMLAVGAPSPEAVRPHREPEPDPTRGPEAGAHPASGHWEELERWRLSASHGRRYARVSGDYNPIHLWPVTSRPFGFRRPILHGHCTQALVAHALIRHRLAGHPEALRRLQITFRSPLTLPGQARLLVRGAEFRVTGQDTVLAEGRWGGEEN